MKKQLLLLATVILNSQFSIVNSVSADDLVKGGQFKDRILPMQGSKTLATLQETDPTATIWGADGVQERYLDNGAEKDGVSYWGGNIMKDASGKYHAYLAVWDATQHHHGYWANSDVYHVTSDYPQGPYTPTDNYNIGAGHNPTVYQAADGTYVLYVLISNKYAYRYKSSTLGDSWGTMEQMPTDLRDRTLSTGGQTTYSNWVFAQRSDKSVYCMDRGGSMWVSQDGLTTFEEVYDKYAYPTTAGHGAFEDPVVWRDEFQYHMIVNNYNAKKAYYSRSKDGYNWVAEDGLAYDPDVAVHPDGTQEAWTKLERPRVCQDSYGRAIYLNMAVIDVEKKEDLAGDTHSSKNIVMPLNPGMRMAVLNTEKITTSTAAIQVKIYKEDPSTGSGQVSFAPATDLDISSLRFGSYATVNAGGGATYTAQETDSEGNLILTFNGVDTGLTDDEFAPKIIGSYASTYTPSFPNATAGMMCYGYAKLSYIDYEPAFLSPVLPTISSESKLTSVEVKNYGLKASTAGTAVKVYAANGTTLLSEGTAESVAQYGTQTVTLTPKAAIPSGNTTLKVVINGNTHTLQITPSILTARTTLSSAISEAETLTAKASYHYGKDALNAAITTAKASQSSYYEPTLSSAVTALSSAVNDFKFANATSKNPVSLTIANADMSSLDGWTIASTETADYGNFKINSKNKTYNLVVSPFAEAFKSGGIAKPNSMMQTLSDLPKGKYVLEADVIAQKSSHGCTGVSLILGNESTACSSATASFSTHYSVEATLTETGSLTFGIDISSESNASWVAWDNVVLQYYGDGTHDNDLYYKASIENVYIKGDGLSSNCYVTVEPDYDNYLNRITTPTDYSVWSKIIDSETGNTWLYNKVTKSFIIPESNSSTFWKTSTHSALSNLGME